MNIVLIGYRGTGKSTIARKLAALLHKKLVSTDEMIVKKAGPIPRIVKKYGWKKFRDIEEKVISDVSKKDNLLIDCGGGVVERPINMRRLKKNGKVILLTANISTIVKRIHKGKNRPSLTGGKSFTDEVRIMLARRKEKYKKAADFSVNTSHLSISEVVRNIWGHFHE